MTNADTTKQTEEREPSKAPLVVGSVVTVGILGFIGWGIWQSLNPAPVPLQGMVDATTISVAAKIPGRISQIYLKEGDMVKPGDLVAEIGIPEISAKLEQVKAQEAAAQAKEDMAQTGARVQEKEAAAADYERARAGLALAQKSFNRVDALYKEGLVSAQRHDEVSAQLAAARELTTAAAAKLSAVREGARKEEKAAAKALVAQAAGGVSEVESLANESALKSPVAGEVTRVVMKAGEVAPAGFPIVMVTDLTDTWVTFSVREEELAKLKKGEKLTATIPALNTDVTLEVTWINPRGNYATWRSTRQNSGYDLRTFEVRARPTEPLDGLRPGMTVVVKR